MKLTKFWSFDSHFKQLTLIWKIVSISIDINVKLNIFAHWWVFSLLDFFLNSLVPCSLAPGSIHVVSFGSYSRSVTRDYLYSGEHWNKMREQHLCRSDKCWVKIPYQSTRKLHFRPVRRPPAGGCNFMQKSE